MVHAIVFAWFIVIKLNVVCGFHVKFFVLISAQHHPKLFISAVIKSKVQKGSTLNLWALEPSATKLQLQRPRVLPVLHTLYLRQHQNAIVINFYTACTLCAWARLDVERPTLRVQPHLTTFHWPSLMLTMQSISLKIHIMYYCIAQKYWRELSLVFGSQIAIAKILDLNLVIQ